MTGVSVLVDGANLRGAMQRLGDARIDAHLFRSWAQGFDTKKAGTRIEWFQAAYPGMGPFYAHLRHAGIQVVTRQPKHLPDGTRKANMDVEIAMAGAKAAVQSETLLLVSGDGDFLPLAEELLRQGLRVIVMAGQEELDRRYRQVISPVDLLAVEEELQWFGYSSWASAS